MHASAGSDYLAPVNADVGEVQVILLSEMDSASICSARGQLPSDPPARSLWTSLAPSAGAACPQLLRT